MSIHKCLQWPWLQHRATSSALGSHSGFTLPWVLLDTLPMAGGWFLLPLLLLLDLAGSTPKAKVSLLSLDESGSRLCFQCSRKPLLAPPGFADLVTSV